MRDGSVAVRDGVITAAGPAVAVATAEPDLPCEDLGAAVLLPGLVDVHCHLEWSLLEGLLPAGAFAPWLSALLALRARQRPDDHAVAADAAALRCLEAGTTTVADSGPTGAGVGALERAGLRGVVFLETFSRATGVAARIEAAQVADRLETLAASAGAPVEVGLSPHAPYSVGPEYWGALAEDARLAGRRWATHLAESAEERAAIGAGDGPVADAFAEIGAVPGRWPGPNGASPVGRLAAAGALRAGLVAAHCVHLDDPDPALLSRAGVAVAHCPTSNVFLGCGRMPIERLRHAGVVVGLGSDSPASGGGYDLRAEARACLELQEDHAPSAEALVRLATLGGARALGLDDRIGSLVPGKRGDLLAVVPRHDDGDPCAMVLHGEASVTLVAIDGQPVVEAGRALRADREAVLTRAARARERLC